MELKTRGRFLLWWQKLFQFRNDCGIHTFGELHVELNDEFAFFKWIAISGHSFAVDALEISGLYALAYDLCFC